MNRRTLLTTLFLAAVAALTNQSANAQWGHHHHGHYGYYGYARPVIVPPPVVIAPAYVAPPPVTYVAPAPVQVVPAVPPAPTIVPPPAYVPSYTYGVVGGRGVGFGYSSPGFGVYVGR